MKTNTRQGIKRGTFRAYYSYEDSNHDSDSGGGNGNSNGSVDDLVIDEVPLQTKLIAPSHCHIVIITF